MDSDDEETTTFHEEEAKAAAAADYADDEHAHILAFLLAIYARDATPRRASSKKGWRKSKPRQRLEVL
jgi:hypothetical protein